ncbi:hypothetical protein C8Q76DRAFT_435384 [Earliella scabrosa]|nr:hypothetical protein C8Q76DRAFT_435384 [Earliella scabrosa]
MSSAPQLVFFPLLLLAIGFDTLHTAAAPSNRTIDDTHGDSITGLRPMYLPPSPVLWNLGNASSGSPVTAPLIDAGQVEGGTWHDATCGPGSAIPEIVLTFNGTAVYVYYIILDFDANLSRRIFGAPFTTYTSLAFYLDNVDVGRYRHGPESKSVDQVYVLYRVPVYVNPSLVDGPHTLRITANGSEFNTISLFDYAEYTSSDSPPDIPSTQTQNPTTTPLDADTAQSVASSSSSRRGSTSPRYHEQSSISESSLPSFLSSSTLTPVSSPRFFPSSSSSVQLPLSGSSPPISKSTSSPTSMHRDINARQVVAIVVTLAFLVAFVVAFWILRRRRAVISQRRRLDPDNSSPDLSTEFKDMTASVLEARRCYSPTRPESLSRLAINPEDSMSNRSRFQVSATLPAPPTPGPLKPSSSSVAVSPLPPSAVLSGINSSSSPAAAAESQDEISRLRSQVAALTAQLISAAHPVSPSEPLPPYEEARSC